MLVRKTLIISQGSVVTHLRCGGMLSDDCYKLTAVKNWSAFGRIMWKSMVALLFTVVD